MATTSDEFPEGKKGKQFDSTMQIQVTVDMNLVPPCPPTVLLPNLLLMVLILFSQKPSMSSFIRFMVPDKKPKEFMSKGVN
jgi:hypothetical protein